jgi:hypothetical protein
MPHNLYYVKSHICSLSGWSLNRRLAASLLPPLHAGPGIRPWCAFICWLTGSWHCQIRSLCELTSCAHCQFVLRIRHTAAGAGLRCTCASVERLVSIMMLMLMLTRMAALRGACVSLLRGAFRTVLMAARTWRIARYSQPGGRIDARARLNSLRKTRWFLRVCDHSYGQQAAKFTIRTGNFTQNDM